MDIRNTWGPPTTAVIISGTGLLDKEITFNGEPVRASVNEDDCLIFLVPSIALGVYDVSVEGTSLGDFTVTYPDSQPEVYAVIPGADDWYTIIGDQFYAGDTVINIGKTATDPGVEYLPSVMSPGECAVVLPSEPTTFTLITPIGSVTYVKP